jgi:hypothetical protein
MAMMRKPIGRFTVVKVVSRPCPLKHSTGVWQSIQKAFLGGHDSLEPMIYMPFLPLKG